MAFAKKAFISGLTALFFATNCLFAHALESNFWKERSASAKAPPAAAGKADKRSDVQLAYLPSSSINAPVEILKALPSPVARLSTALSKRMEREIPQGDVGSLRPILQTLSSQYGTVRGIRLTEANSPHSRTIIHIQDVHLNPEAQKNIGQTVQQLIAQRKIDLIALEGAFASVDLAPYRTFEDKRAVDIVADYLLRENRISGAVHAAFTSPENIPAVVGVDDPAHYNANVKAYLDSLPKKDAIKKYIEGKKHGVALRAAALMNPGLKDFHARVLAYQAGDFSMGDYVKLLTSYVKDVSPEVEMFRQASGLESSLDFKTVEAERNSLLAQLLPRLNQKESKELLNFSIAFRMGNLSNVDFYQYLQDLVQDKHIQLTRYKSMEAYLQYVLLSDGINSEKLLPELARMEKKAYDQLIKTSAERALVAESKRLYLEGKLLDFALTPDEWKEYKDFRQARTPPHVSQWGGWEGMNRVIPYKENPIHTPPNLPFVRQGEESPINLASFEKFYIEAELRNNLMSQNLLKAMDEHHARTAVLVTGGFHAEGIESLLHARDPHLTTVSFVPKLTKVDSDKGFSYLSVFAQEKTPLDQLFAGEKLFVTPNPVAGCRSPTLAIEAATEARLTGDTGIAETDASRAGLRIKINMAGRDLIEAIGERSRLMVRFISLKNEILNVSFRPLNEGFILGGVILRQVVAAACHFLARCAIGIWNGISHLQFPKLEFDLIPDFDGTATQHLTLRWIDFRAETQGTSAAASGKLPNQPKENPFATVKTIIFDIDGVLLNTIPINREGFAAVYLQIIRDSGSIIGKGRPDEEIREFGRAFFNDRIGRSSDSMRDDLLKDMAAEGRPVPNNQEPYIAIYERTRGELLHQILKKNPKALLMPGAEAMLTELKRRGYRIAIASASSLTVGWNLLERTGLASYFDRADVKLVAGLPEKIEAMRSMIGEQAEEVLFVDDAPDAVDAARKHLPGALRIAGMPATEDHAKKMYGKTNARISSLLDLLDLLPTRDGKGALPGASSSGPSKKFNSGKKLLGIGLVTLLGLAGASAQTILKNPPMTNSVILNPTLGMEAINSGSVVSVIILLLFLGMIRYCAAYVFVETVKNRKGDKIPRKSDSLFLPFLYSIITTSSFALVGIAAYFGAIELGMTPSFSNVITWILSGFSLIFSLRRFTRLYKHQFTRDLKVDFNLRFFIFFPLVMGIPQFFESYSYFPLLLRIFLTTVFFNILNLWSRRWFINRFPLLLIGGLTGLLASSALGQPLTNIAISLTVTPSSVEQPSSQAKPASVEKSIGTNPLIYTPTATDFSSNLVAAALNKLTNNEAYQGIDFSPFVRDLRETNLPVNVQLELIHQADKGLSILKRINPKILPTYFWRLGWGNEIDLAESAFTVVDTNGLFRLTRVDAFHLPENFWKLIVGRNLKYDLLPDESQRAWEEIAGAGREQAKKNRSTALKNPIGDITTNGFRGWGRHLTERETPGSMIFPVFGIDQVQFEAKLKRTLWFEGSEKTDSLNPPEKKYFDSLIATGKPPQDSHFRPFVGWRWISVVPLLLAVLWGYKKFKNNNKVTRMFYGIGWVLLLGLASCGTQRGECFKMESSAIVKPVVPAIEQKVQTGLSSFPMVQSPTNASLFSLTGKSIPIIFGETNNAISLTITPTSADPTNQVICVTVRVVTENGKWYRAIIAFPREKEADVVKVDLFRDSAFSRTSFFDGPNNTLTLTLLVSELDSLRWAPRELWVEIIRATGDAGWFRVIVSPSSKTGSGIPGINKKDSGTNFNPVLNGGKKLLGISLVTLLGLAGARAQEAVNVIATNAPAAKDAASSLADPFLFGPIIISIFILALIFSQLFWPKKFASYAGRMINRRFRGLMVLLLSLLLWGTTAMGQVFNPTSKLQTSDDALRFADAQLQYTNGQAVQLLPAFLVPPGTPGSFNNVITEGVGLYDESVEMLLRLKKGGTNNLASVENRLKTWADPSEQYGTMTLTARPNEHTTAYEPFNTLTNYLFNWTRKTATWSNDWTDYDVFTGPNAWRLMATAEYVLKERELGNAPDPTIVARGEKTARAMLLLQIPEGAIRFGPKIGSGSSDLTFWNMIAIEHQADAYAALNDWYKATNNIVYKNAADKIWNWMTNATVYVNGVQQQGLLHQGTNGVYFYTAVKFNTVSLQWEVVQHRATDSIGTWSLQSFKRDKINAAYGPNTADQMIQFIRDHCARTDTFGLVGTNQHPAGLDFSDTWTINEIPINNTTALISPEWSDPNYLSESIDARLREGVFHGGGQVTDQVYGWTVDFFSIWNFLNKTNGNAGSGPGLGYPRYGDSTHGWQIPLNPAVWNVPSILRFVGSPLFDASDAVANTGTSGFSKFLYPYQNKFRDWGFQVFYSKATGNGSFSQVTTNAQGQTTYIGAVNEGTSLALMSLTKNANGAVTNSQSYIFGPTNSSMIITAGGKTNSWTYPKNPMNEGNIFVGHKTNGVNTLYLNLPSWFESQAKTNLGTALTNGPIKLWSSVNKGVGQSDLKHASQYLAKLLGPSDQIYSRKEFLAAVTKRDSNPMLLRRLMKVTTSDQPKLASMDMMVPVKRDIYLRRSPSVVGLIIFAVGLFGALGANAQESTFVVSEIPGSSFLLIVYFITVGIVTLGMWAAVRSRYRSMGLLHPVQHPNWIYLVLGVGEIGVAVFFGCLAALMALWDNIWSAGKSYVKNKLLASHYQNPFAKKAEAALVVLILGNLSAMAQSGVSTGGNDDGEAMRFGLMFLFFLGSLILGLILYTFFFWRQWRRDLSNVREYWKSQIVKRAAGPALRSLAKVEDLAPLSLAVARGIMASNNGRLQTAHYVEILGKVKEIGVDGENGGRDLTIEERELVIGQVDQNLESELKKEKAKILLNEEQSMNLSYEIAQTINSYPGADAGRMNYVQSLPDRDLENSGFDAAVAEAKALMAKAWMKNKILYIEVNMKDRNPFWENFRDYPRRVYPIYRKDNISLNEFYDTSKFVRRIKDRKGLPFLQNSILTLPEGCTGLNNISDDLRDLVHMVRMAELLMGHAASANVGMMLKLYEVIRKHA